MGANAIIIRENSIKLAILRKQKKDTLIRVQLAYTTPLLVKPNDEIYSFDFRIKKIFIKKKGSEEDGIVGYAELKNGLETNEFYRIFEVHPCGIDEYHKYIFNFINDYPQVTLNYYAMEGTIIICKD